MQPGITCRRGDAHSSAVRGGLPKEITDLSESPLPSTNVSLGIGDGEEYTVRTMNINLTDIGKEEKELKENVSRLPSYLNQKERYVNALANHLQCLEESSQRLTLGNENIPVTEQ